MQRVLLGLAVALIMLSTSPAWPQSGYHYIVGLNPQGDNFLALRSAPSGRGYRMARLGPATLLSPTGARVGRWLQVDVVNTQHEGLSGWVFDRYVACCSGSAPQPAASGTGRVIHPTGAALNLRNGPSLNARVIGGIPHGTGGVPVGECIYESPVRSWCQVVYGGRNGWVSTRYFFID